jgi:hypothetical protein
MANIYEWLEDVELPYYASTSSSFREPPAPRLEPMDGVFFAEDPMDPIVPLNIDENGNMYFDMPPERNAPQTQDDSIPIDPALLARTHPPAPAPTTSGETVIEIASRLSRPDVEILICLAQLLQAFEASRNSKNTESSVIAQGLGASESTAEDEFESEIPDTIDGILVNRNPQAEEIKEVVDFRRVGLHRQSVYLAEIIYGGYYWFRIPHADRGRELRQLIGEYRYKSREEITGRKTRGVGDLRNGKSVGT